MNYWKEAFMAALEEIGMLSPDNEKLDIAVDILKGAHENYGMAHGYDCIPNPLKTENDDLKRKLKHERSKEYCRTCDGTGRIITRGGTFESNSQCWKCHGEGKVAA